MKKMLLPIGLFIAGVLLAPMVKPLIDNLLKRKTVSTEDVEDLKISNEKTI